MKMCSWFKRWDYYVYFCLEDYPMHIYDNWKTCFHWSVRYDCISDTDAVWDLECWTDNTFYLLHNYYDNDDVIINC